MNQNKDTICAVATPSGKGGVSIIRVSGPLALSVAQSVLKITPTPRMAHYGKFYDAQNTVLDVGVGLFFKGPESFTGEDILELQAHGGPVLIDLLLQYLLSLGLRLARPGEFSERAFLNDKIDLTQAEAIADLIESQSKEAAKSALNSLQGEFSRQVNQLVEETTKLRIYIEAAIDFPEEEIDFLETGKVKKELEKLNSSLLSIFTQARQGSILKEGLKVVIAGEPNAGKSSLLNALSGQERAIVTNIAGTTRDSLHEHILIHGIPLHIIDTAGLRESSDLVEQEGIKRSWQQIAQADFILLVHDSTQKHQNALLEEFSNRLESLSNIILVYNKVDLSNDPPSLIVDPTTKLRLIRLSAKEGQGLSLLRDLLRDCSGIQSGIEGGFSARRRHLDALQRAQHFLENAHNQFTLSRAGELIAQDLLEAQQALSEITGEFSSDDLLGKIFSSFCIGK